jgi:hypothetical protein
MALGARAGRGGSSLEGPGKRPMCDASARGAVPFGRTCRGSSEDQGPRGHPSLLPRPGAGAGGAFGALRILALDPRSRSDWGLVQRIGLKSYIRAGTHPLKYGISFFRPVFCMGRDLLMARTGVIEREQLLQHPEERRARESLEARLQDVRRSGERAVRELMTGEAARRRHQLSERLRKSR